MSAPYDYKVLIDQPHADTKCECGSCKWKGSYGALLEIGDCSLTPGDPSPAGRCPQCETLAYIVAQASNDLPNIIRRLIDQIKATSAWEDAERGEDPTMTKAVEDAEAALAAGK